MSKISLEGKTRLPGKIQDSIQDAAVVCSQIVKGSKSSEVLGTAIKNFTLQDGAIENSGSNVRRLSVLISHMKIQIESIEKR
uniref:BLOC-1-related complex subunit 7 n=1 Tax=Plectus sambesii TaxID=2011161 RepID=A0A914UXB0_9BILA